MPRTTNNITHGGRRATVHHPARRHAPSAQRIEERVEKATRLVLGERDQRKQRALTGAAVVVAAAAVTAGVIERRMLAKAAGTAMDRTARMGRSMALATGFRRRRPLYVRALPGIGIGVGLLAASAVAVAFLPRVLRASLDAEPETQRPSYEQSALEHRAGSAGLGGAVDEEAEEGRSHDRG
jgi:hypothetical protein